MLAVSQDNLPIVVGNYLPILHKIFLLNSVSNYILYCTKSSFPTSITISALYSTAIWSQTVIFHIITFKIYERIDCLSRNSSLIRPNILYSNVFQMYSWILLVFYPFFLFTFTVFLTMGLGAEYNIQYIE